ncbi:MAG TPA: molybdate ABC transporter substrate-binding protein [Steroidobacteraceae bacterium]|nr:molybdate ABC transporter substrate-binding protein [Steroidobacteraceae bacterium]
MTSKRYPHSEGTRSWQGVSRRKSLIRGCGPKPAAPRGAPALLVFAGALGEGRRATGDPDSVPVGRYARAALMKLGVWPQVSGRLVAAENVRAALEYVARGEAPLGIVYRTDAQAEKRVRVVAVFPPDSHPPITYPLALTAAALGNYRTIWPDNS